MATRRLPVRHSSQEKNRPMSEHLEDADRRVADVQRCPQARGDQGRAPEAEARAGQRRQQKAAEQQLLRQRGADADDGGRQRPVRPPHELNEGAQIRVQVARRWSCIERSTRTICKTARARSAAGVGAPSAGEPRAAPTRRARPPRKRAGKQGQQRRPDLPEGKNAAGQPRCVAGASRGPAVDDASLPPAEREQ